mmetsp:Transcript_22362/g.75939  ORF Transcript_22362/g.75939 Transcript_22362/m.75939 type:complete len:106 (+) Transcript_22362:2-319(+)
MFLENGKYYPKAGETVAIHYRMFLENGKEVDSTHTRGKPFIFKVCSGQVIKGWDEVVKQLSVGDKCRCTFTPELAYSTRGFPGLVPPNSKLEVEVHLVSITSSAL